MAVTPPRRRCAIIDPPSQERMKTFTRSCKSVQKRIFLDLEAEETSTKKMAVELKPMVATEATVGAMEPEAFLVYVLGNMLSSSDLPSGPGMYEHAVLGSMYQKIFAAGALHVPVSHAFLGQCIAKLEGKELEVVLFVLRHLTETGVDDLDLQSLPHVHLVFMKVVLNLVRFKREKHARIKAMAKLFFA